MKLLFPSLAIAFASPILVAAAPPAPVQAQVQQQPVAQPPSIERQQLGRRYIALALSPQDYLDTLRAGIAAGFSHRVGASLDASETAEADEMMKRFFALYEPKVRERLPNVFEAYAQVYAREFSAEELRQMIDFAETPAGRHYVSRRLALDTDPAVLMQEEGIQNDALPILQQIYKEQCAAKAAKRIAAGDKKARCPLSSATETSAG
jgi:hypothetical protein